MKYTLFIISILFSIAIGFYQYNRMYNEYTTSEVVVSEPLILEEPPQEYRDMPDSPDRDSLRVVIIPEDHRMERRLPPETSEPVISEQGHYTPSDIALEAKFWVDIIVSLLSAIAPILIPIIIYRKKKDES